MGEYKQGALGKYDSALVCLNGHLINRYATLSTVDNTDFSDQCGAVALTKCQHCEALIRGQHLRQYYGQRIHRMTKPASYCPSCGKPYPWTESAIKSAEEIIDLFDEIEDSDKEKLKESLPDLAHQTPKSEMAAKRWETIAKKVGGDLYSVIIKVGTDVASEYTKKLLTGQL